MSISLPVHSTRNPEIERKERLADGASEPECACNLARRAMVLVLLFAQRRNQTSSLLEPSHNFAITFTVQPSAGKLADSAFHLVTVNGRHIRALVRFQTFLLAQAVWS